MSDQNDKIGTSEREALSEIASDALKIFRAGLFMIVIYLTIISLTLRTGGTNYVENIFSSRYTLIGIMFWTGSMMVSVFTHRRARRVTLMDQYSHLGRINDKLDVLNLSSAGSFGLIISVFSLIVGFWEGWLNTINKSSITVGVEQPLIIIGISVLLVAIIYNIFSLLDLIRSRWGPVRKILRIS